MQTDADWMCLNCLCEVSSFTTTFSRILERKLRPDTGRYLFMLSLLILHQGESRANLKCEGKGLSVRDMLHIDAIGIIKVSIQSFTKLVGIGCQSDDLHGANRTRLRTISAVTQNGFCKTFVVSGGFNTRKCES